MDKKYIKLEPNTLKKCTKLDPDSNPKNCTRTFLKHTQKVLYENAWNLDVRSLSTGPGPA
jgi:hypothetical protein